MRIRLLFLAALFAGAHLRAFGATPGSALPPALHGVDPRRLSNCTFAALDALGAFGAQSRPPLAPATQVTLRASATPTSLYSDSSRLSVLDARAGHNQSIGSPPAALASGSHQAAEPHLFRAAGLTLGAVQDGRFSDGGAAVCDYVFSEDGGYHWTRDVLPHLTSVSGGPYFRATDPVAAIDSDGTCYVNTLAAADSAFNIGVVVVSHSISIGGTTVSPSISWSDPVVAYRPPNSSVFTDKNWIAVNNYAGTATAHRVAVTYTVFSSNSAGAATGSNAVVLLSDDHGNTWTNPIDITPQGSSIQGTQPIFLPDGSLFCCYFVFTDATNANLGRIECKRSMDGGRTWPTTGTHIIDNLTCYGDPVLRTGSFLPNATIAQDTGELWVSIAAVWHGVPRIIVMHSTDDGASWSQPVVASDTPGNLGVCLPTLSATSSGSTVALTFMDKRDAPDGQNYVDLYGTLSFDGGTTWQPNVRLSQHSSDVRLAQSTSEGYMLGDYMGLAPSDSTQPSFTALWCGTSEGDSRPTSAQFADAAAGSYTAWKIANFNTTTRGNQGFDSETFDGGTRPVWQDYAFGMDPWIRSDGALLQGDLASGVLTLSHPERNSPDLTFSYENSTDGATWAPANPIQTPSLKTVPGNPGLVEATATVSASGSSTGYFRVRPAIIGVAPPAGPLEAFVVNSTSRITALSALGTVASGQGQLVAGFYIAAGTKNILVRGVGPTLAGFGISNPLPDPVIQLDSVSGLPSSETNDNWTPTPELLATFQRLGNFALTSPLESVILAPFAAGGYTATLGDSQGRTGTAIAEFYDADINPGAARLVAVSARGYIGTSTGQSLVVGFIIAGATPRRVLVRAVGPGLAGYGISQPLATPLLSIYQINGPSGAIAVNHAWTSTPNPDAVSDAIQTSHAFAIPAGSADCAMLLTLQAGNYTANVTGLSGSSGVVIVEVYDLP